MKLQPWWINHRFLSGRYVSSGVLTPRKTRCWLLGLTSLTSQTSKMTFAAHSNTFKPFIGIKHKLYCTRIHKFMPLHSAWFQCSLISELIIPCFEKFFSKENGILIFSDLKYQEITCIYYFTLLCPYLAMTKSSRTIREPSPMNFWTSSEPETRMNVHSVWWATARANSVLPVPGGPYSSTPW